MNFNSKPSLDRWKFQSHHVEGLCPFSSYRTDCLMLCTQSTAKLKRAVSYGGRGAFQLCLCAVLQSARCLPQHSDCCKGWCQEPWDRTSKRSMMSSPKECVHRQRGSTELQCLSLQSASASASSGTPAHGVCPVSTHTLYPLLS